MKFVILHILCEGQTEERFVKEVLAPYLRQLNIYSKPILLVTSRKKNAKGGMLSYSQAKRDLMIMRNQFMDNSSEQHLFTTMFDFYALPDDFPSFQESSHISDVRERITFIEQQFAKDLGIDQFIPYIQLHEFEALLFVDITRLEEEYPLAKDQIRRLKEETDVFGDPEMINNSRATSPSKRIIKALEKKYNYNKVQSGASITARIGMEALLKHCQHFNEWVEKIRLCATNNP